MAAVIDIHTGLGITAPSRPATARPAAPLRLIEGGRSRSVQLQRRTFLRRRVLVAVVAAVVLFVVVQLAGAAISAFTVESAPTRPIAGESYRVESGDTLWAIAQRLEPDADPRGVVDRLIQANPDAVTGQGMLRAGQVLVLPRS